MKANRNLHRVQRKAYALAEGLKEFGDECLIREVADDQEKALLDETRQALFKLSSRLHLKARARERTSRTVRTARCA